MKNFPSILLALAVSIPATWFATRELSSPTTKAASTANASPSERKVLYFQSPMHPWIKSDKPGRCTICGMNLTPVYEGEPGHQSDTSIVTLEPSSTVALHVTSVPVGVHPLLKSLRFSGMVDDNASRHRYLSAYVGGRLEKLHVIYEGQEVVEGQPLAEFYSPALLAAEAEYRSLSGDLRKNAVGRLRRMGLTPAQIAALPDKPEDVHTSSLVAPQTGTVVTRSAYEGQYVQEGERLFEIADFSTMWFIFNAFESDLPWLRVGQTVEVTTPSLPGHVFTGPITFIDPNLDESTRTAKVRVELPNPLVEGRRTFLHRLSGEGRVSVEAPAVLAVPRSAVLQTGREAVVFVDLGGGGYERRTVTLGRRGDELVEVVSGLEIKEQVVTNGNLLLDSQAELNRAYQTAPETPAAPKPAGPAPAAAAVHNHGS